MKYRYIARIVVESITPLAVGTGERDVVTDQLVAKDVNGLPYVPGAALAGIIRHSSTKNNKEQIDRIFGFQGKQDEESEGARLIFSDAVIIGSEGKVLDGLIDVDFSNTFYHNFKNLPIRQHVKITEKGSAEKRGKFDNQVVYAGTRFCSEIEMVSDNSLEDQSNWKSIISALSEPGFRIGGGTRKGYGAIKIVELKECQLDLSVRLNDYLNKTSELNDPFWNSIGNTIPEVSIVPDYDKYTLRLIPEDFYLFSSGFESVLANMTYVTEANIEWSLENQPTFSQKKILIPASSVKGAIAHRVAYHYNRFKGIYADNFDKDSMPKTDENEAVKTLFGYLAANEDGQRGNVLFSDVFSDDNNMEKLLNHVSIDRFTGGALAGALFSEEVIYGNNEVIEMTVMVKKNSVTDQSIENALVASLKDICNGMLPLGGGTMRGHGTFSGKMTKNEMEEQL